MVEVRTLTGDDVRRLLDLDALVDALAGAFAALSDGEVQAPPRSQLAAADGILLSMPAYRPGAPFGVKLVSVFEGNGAIGLPAHMAIIALFDEETGAPHRARGRDLDHRRPHGGRLRPLVPARGAPGEPGPRDRRRRRAGALPPRGDPAGPPHRGDPHRVGVPGGGTRPWPRSTAVRASRRPSRRRSAAPTSSRCAPAVPGPVVDPAWIAPGTHVTSVGYRPPAGELPPELAARARLLVETRVAFEPTPVGCGELAGLDPASGAELGEVVLGRRPGRIGPDEITVYKAMGHAVEDLVAARLVYERALVEGAGSVVAL